MTGGLFSVPSGRVQCRTCPGVKTPGYSHDVPTGPLLGSRRTEPTARAPLAAPAAGALPRERFPRTGARRVLLNLVGTARCAVRAAFSGATMPPAASRARTSRRDVPTKVRFMGRVNASVLHNLKVADTTLRVLMPTNELFWYVAHTRPRREKKLAEYCEREGFLVTLPCYRTVHKISRQKRSRSRSRSFPAMYSSNC